MASTAGTPPQNTGYLSSPPDSDDFLYALLKALDDAAIEYLLWGTMPLEAFGVPTALLARPPL